jgi:hypothetical protein
MPDLRSAHAALHRRWTSNDAADAPSGAMKVGARPSPNATPLPRRAQPSARLVRHALVSEPAPSILPKEHRHSPATGRCSRSRMFGAPALDRTAVPAPLTPSAPASRRPPRFFLSHYRGDAARIASLQQALQLRGLHAWRDVDDLAVGHGFEDAIRRAIRSEVSAFIAYVTPDFLTRDIIWRVEVPEALERARRDATFLIVPLFCGVTPDELRAVCARHGLVNLADFNGLMVPLGPRSKAREAHRQVAKRTLRASIGRLFKADPAYVPRLLLRSQAHAPGPLGVDLDLDWSAPFAGGCPSPDEWERDLLPALVDVRDTLGALSRRHAHVEVQARLSAPLALGEVLSDTAKYTLEFGGTNGAWTTAAARREAPVLVRQELAAPGRDRSVALVEVSLARAVGRAVATHAGGLDADAPGRAVRLEPAGGPATTAVEDASWAVSAAWEVGACLRAMHDEGVEHFHLYVAAPAEWCVLLGHTLNAVGRITVHQWHPTSGGYVRACTLGAVDGPAPRTAR